MGEVSNRFSMRSLRSSMASDVFSPRSSRISGIKQDEASTAYQAIPSRSLKIADVKLERASYTKYSSGAKETSKARKRRRWKEIQERGNLNKDTERKQNYDWRYLPDLILEQIFQYLTYKGKVSAGLACSEWRRILYISSIYSHLAVSGESMCTWRYDLAKRDYEATLDHMRVSSMLNAIGHKLKSLAFVPSENLHNIVDFQIVINRFCAINNRKLPNIKYFCYKFPCDFASKNNEVDIYGTGGMILQNMKNLLECLPGLERLELVDLQLDGNDAEHVLDEVGDVCRYSLRNLRIVNISRLPFSMLSIAGFENLRVLVISPHNLGDDLVENIGSMKKLRNLHILSNAYTETIPTPVDYRIWKQCRRSHPRLRVHLVTEGKHRKELTFQSRAPVKSVVYDTPYTRVNQFSINLVVELYRTDLEVYVHRQLPRFSRSRSFHERADSAYLYLIRQCPYIHTLMIRERISSCTVLLLAYTGKNLRYFHVRQNGIILKCDWPKSPDWSEEFYAWLKRTSKSYKDMETEVSQILGFRWYALTDKQFKLTHVNLNYQHYYEGFEEAG